MCFTKDSTKLVLGSVEGVIKVFDMDHTFTIQRAIYAYNGRLLFLEISPCGNYLVSVGLEQAPGTGLEEKLKIWSLNPKNAPSFHLLKTAKLSKDIKRLSFHNLMRVNTEVMCLAVGSNT